MKFLDGLKTIIGLIGTVVSIALPKLAPQIGEAVPHVIAVAQGAFGLLAVLGIIHKAEKAKG